MPDLSQPIRGKVWKVGDSVDTNQLAGGGLAAKTEQETLRINCLRGIRPDFTEGVEPGDIVVAGTNFGCGSSRQTAVEALQLCGVAAVLAESVARIHRRNSIALALPTFVVPGVSQLFSDQDQAEIDHEAGLVRNLTTGKELSFSRLPGNVTEVYRAGGLTELIKERLATMGIAPTPA